MHACKHTRTSTHTYTPGLHPHVTGLGPGANGCPLQTGHVLSSAQLCLQLDLLSLHCPRAPATGVWPCGSWWRWPIQQASLQLLPTSTPIAHHHPLPGPRPGTLTSPRAASFPQSCFLSPIFNSSIPDLATTSPMASFPLFSLWPSTPHLKIAFFLCLCRIPNTFSIRNISGLIP